MKVLYVLPSGSMYGDNVALMGIMPYMVKKGITPYFIVVQNGPIETYLREHNYDYEVIHYPYSTYPLSCSFKGMLHEIKCQLLIWKRYRSLKKGLEVIKCFSPDIIHTNTSSNLLGYFLARKSGTSHVMHIREYMRLDHNNEYIPTKSFFIRLIKWEKNFNIAITPGVNNYFGNLDNTKTIYDGVISKTGAPIVLNQQKSDEVLFVGRLVETKGLTHLINAFCTARTNRHKLKIVGTGSDSYVQELKNIVEKNNKTEYVEFLGYRTDVYSLMKKAKAIIVASRFEAFGFITAEAMYNGCLVIGHNTAGTKMQFDNGESLFGQPIGIRYNSLEELRTKIEEVCNSDYSSYTATRIAAQNTVLSLYTVENSAKEVFTLYKQILNKQK